MNVWAVIPAAGTGSRAGFAKNKILQPLGGVSVLRRTAPVFARHPRVGGICVCASEADREAIGRELAGMENVLLAPGGATRTESVKNALEALAALPCPPDYVLIHDAARPFVSQKVIHDCIDTVRQFGSAVCALPCTDTAVRAENWFAAARVERENLYTLQTPQGFEASLIKRAYQKAYEDGFYGTDDASLVDRLGEQVAISEGSYSNIKLTTREDLPVDTQMRVGHGFDVHRLTENRKLILCGVEIPFEKGLLGHSDADVALHALMDAMLGAACLGDIGKHFPDSDMSYKDIESLRLLAEVARLLAKQGWSLVNADITIMAQRPKLLPHIEAMRQNIADTLGIAGDCISVKATTTEKLGFVGREEGIAAEAVCMLSKR